MRLVESKQSDARNVSRIIPKTKWSGRASGAMLVPATIGGGIIRSKIFRELRFGKSRLFKAQVVVRQAEDE